LAIWLILTSFDFYLTGNLSPRIELKSNDDWATANRAVFNVLLVQTLCLVHWDDNVLTTTGANVIGFVDHPDSLHVLTLRRHFAL